MISEGSVGERSVCYLMEGGIRLFLPQRLHAIRLHHNRSQDDIAAQMGVSRQTVAKWENGASFPSGSNARALFLLLGSDGPRIFPCIAEVEDEMVDSEEIKAEIHQN